MSTLQKKIRTNNSSILNCTCIAGHHDDYIGSSILLWGEEANAIEERALHPPNEINSSRSYSSQRRTKPGGFRGAQLACSPFQRGRLPAEMCMRALFIIQVGWSTISSIIHACLVSSMDHERENTCNKFYMCMRAVYDSHGFRVYRFSWQFCKRLSTFFSYSHVYGLFGLSFWFRDGG
jgi:hypothetical protein